MSKLYFVHENAICESTHIGEKTKIWAFSHVLPGAKIGSNCNICDHVFIENNVIVGNNVTIKCGVQLWDGLRVQDNVFIGPNVTFTNDMFPRSKIYPEHYLTTTIEEGASIGANATLLPGVVVGRGAMVGAGSVVTKNVPPYAVVAGNPAQILRYQTEKTECASMTQALNKKKTITLDVNQCQLWTSPAMTDKRGSLAVTQFSEDLPFVPKRCFFVYGVEFDKVRGEHAHKVCEQFLVAVHGRVHAVIDDGIKRQEIILDSPTAGLYMPAGTWGVQYNFSADAVLCVFASENYSSDDYIRNYDDFLHYVAHQQCEPVS